MINQAKLKTYRHEPFWKFGVLVLQNHAQAVELDKANGNTKWQDAKVTERSQLLDYNKFVDKGLGGAAPSGYPFMVPS
jgi:hypothetical protein